MNIHEDCHLKHKVELPNAVGEGSVRRAALTSVAPAPAEQDFQLDLFARSEDGLMVAKSLFGLAAQDFRINKDRWKLVADNSDSINMARLRQQQQRLALIRALGVFCSHQTILRYYQCPGWFFLDDSTRKVG